MKKAFLLIGAMIAMTACGNKNVFMEKWDSPDGTAPFSKITTARKE